MLCWRCFNARDAQVAIPNILQIAAGIFLLQVCTCTTLIYFTAKASTVTKCQACTTVSEAICAKQPRRKVTLSLQDCREGQKPPGVS